MDLSFNDKRLVGLFDKDFARCMGFLSQVPPGSLRDAAKAKEYQDLGERLRQRLAPIQQQDHPEVSTRREQIAEYDAALAVALAGQGPAGAAAQRDGAATPTETQAKSPTRPAPARQAAEGLKAFSTLHVRWTTYLRAERPHTLAKAPMLQKYRSAATEMEGAIAAAQGCAPEEAQAAREQVAAYLAEIERMVASAQASLSGDDSLRVKRFRDENATAMASLQGCDRTVLGPDGGDGPHHATSRRHHDMLALVQNVDHADAKAALAALEEFDDVLAEKTATSKAALAKLLATGDLFAAIDGHLRSFEDSAFPPRIAAEPEDGEVARFASALRSWHDRAAQALPFLEDALRWAPMLEGKVDLLDRIRRFLADRPRELREAETAATGAWQSAVDKALAIDPAVLDPDVLADGAQEAAATLDAGAVAALRLARFGEATAGKRDPAREAAAADLQGRAASIRPRCAAAAAERLRGTRLPAALDYPELLQIAKGLIKQPAERVIVTREVHRTERESQPIGSFVYLEVYDVFWVHAAIREDDGTFRVYEYSFCYSLKGTPGTVCNQWAIAEVYPGRQILPENMHLPPE